MEEEDLFKLDEKDEKQIGAMRQRIRQNSISHSSRNNSSIIIADNEYSTSPMAVKQNKLRR